MTGEAFYESELYEELCELTTSLGRWYYIDSDKIKWYVIYVYDIDDHEINLFDIWPDEIVTFDDNHAIPSKAMKVIRKIQEKLCEINTYLEED